jgi:hypothetical protein
MESVKSHFDRSPNESRLKGPLAVASGPFQPVRRPFIEKVSRLQMSCGSFPSTLNHSVLVRSSAFKRRRSHSIPHDFPRGLR